MLKFEIPNIKKFLYPLIGTMTVFQLSFQTQIPFKNIYASPYGWTVYEAQTLVLQNAIYFMGCVLGTQLYRKLQSYSNKFIFLFSDILYVLSSFSLFLINKQKHECHQNQQTCDKVSTSQIYIDLYFMLRIFTGISTGLNYVQSIIYLIRVTKKQERQFFLLLIPLFLIVGQGIGSTQQYGYGSIQLMGYTPVIAFFLLSNIIAIIRMILLQFLTIETPHYYIHSNKNIQQAQKLYLQIHECNIEEFEEFCKQEQNMKSLEDKTLNMVSTSFFKKYLKCFLLILFTTFSGQQLIFTYLCQDINFQFLTLLGVLIILCQMIFFHYLRRKKIVCIIGQFIICVGISLIDVSNKGSLYIIQLGYCLGLGTQVYSIIGFEIPDFGIIFCINIQWIVQLFEMCLIGMHTTAVTNAKSDYTSNDIISLFQGFIVIYLAFSFAGFMLLFAILRSPIKIHPSAKKQEQNNLNENINESKLD